MATKPESLESIFWIAREKSPDELAGFLDGACADRPDLRRRVEKMLEAEPKVRGFLETPPVVHVAPLDPPHALGDFRIVREIARGGMGVVYEAEQLSLNRTVALKVLPFAAMLDERRLKRFQLEAQAAAGLHHANIVPVYGVGSERGVHFYAMQFIEGHTLAELVAELRKLSGQDAGGDDGRSAALSLASELASGRFEPARKGSEEPEIMASHSPSGNGAGAVDGPSAERSTETVNGLVTDVASERATNSPAYFRTVAALGVQAAEALEYAHRSGVIHRDIKPSNVIVDAAGNLWITDFGLAQMETDSNLTMTGDLAGTLRYMSPEQTSGNRVLLDHRTDVYSLGATLYEMLTLRPVVDGADRAEILRRVSFEDPIAPRRIDGKIPADLETIILKAMAKVPDERYATSQKLADDLRRYLEHKSIWARRPTLMQRATKWSRRHVGIVWMGLAASMILAGVFALSTALVLESNREARANYDDANEQRRKAQLERNAAVRQRNAAKRNQYYADIVSGQADWKEGNIGNLHHKLNSHLPIAGEEDRRGWEWFYLLSLCHPEERTMFHHGLRPFASWSPDGEYVAIAGVIWKARSGECIRRFSTSNIKRDRVAWSPNGRKFAWGMVSDDDGIYIWDRATDTVTSLRGHGSSVWCLAWNPDGTQLASGSMDETVRIWDVAQGVTVRDWPAGSYVRQVAWSPDGKLLASSVSRTGLKIWKIATGELVVVRKERQGRVRVSWRPDGAQLAVSDGTDWYLLNRSDWTLARPPQPVAGAAKDASWSEAVSWNKDGSRLALAHGESVTIWDPSDMQPAATIRGHLRVVTSVAWSPDGRHLVTSDDEEEIKIWDLDSPVQPPPISTGGSIASLFWLADARALVTVSAADDSCSFWDARKGSRIKVEPSKVEGPVQWSSDHRLLAVRAGSDDEPGIAVHDADSGAVHSIWKGQAKHRLHDFFWAPDGAKIAIVTTFEGSQDVEFWDIVRERTISRWKKQRVKNSSHTAQIRWAGDSTRVAAVNNGDVGDNGSVKHHRHAHVIDVASGERILKHKLGSWSHSGSISAVAWSPDGRKLACGGSHGSVEVLDVDSRRVSFSVKPHNLPIDSLVWSSDGTRLASASQDWTVKVIEARDGAQLLTFPFEESNPTRVAWSPDGRRLAAATKDGTIQVWDAARGYEFSVDGSRRSELAWIHYRRGMAGGPDDEEDLREFLRLIPDTLGFWQERGHASAMLGHFDQAAREFGKATLPDVGLSYGPAYYRTLALLGKRDMDIYREACAFLVDAFSESDVPSNRGYIAWLCVLSPNPLVDSTKVVRMSRESHDHRGNENQHDQVLTMGASLFRDGRRAAAVDTLTTLVDQLDRGGDATDRYELACAQFFIALARHDQGHEFQARRYLAEATRVSETLRQTNRYWPRTVVLDTLRREAEAVIGE